MNPLFLNKVHQARSIQGDVKMEMGTGNAVFIANYRVQNAIFRFIRLIET